MESDPLFLDEETVIELHDAQIRQFTPMEDLTLGDHPGLASAIASPQQTCFYDSSATLFDLAAGYAYHVSMKQAFINGNKRTGLQCALVFLDMNGVTVESDEETLFAEVSELHKNPPEIAKKKFSDFLRIRSVRRGGLTEWIRRNFFR